MIISTKKIVNVQPTLTRYVVSKHIEFFGCFLLFLGFYEDTPVEIVHIPERSTYDMFMHMTRDIALKPVGFVDVLLMKHGIS